VRQRHSRLWCGLALGVALTPVSATRANAHPVPFSYLDVRIESGVINVTLVAHVFDIAHDLDITPPEELLKADVARARTPSMTALLGPRIALAADGRPLTPVWSPTSDVLPDRQSIRFQIRYEPPAAPGSIQITATMFPYDPNHQTFVNVYEGEALTQAILDRGRPTFDYFAGTRQGVTAVIRKFVPAGIHHILIGPDHLLFLIGLLLLGGTVRQLLLVVTSFTIAHSITLSLAALNIVSPPARIIEPAIALSIVYVGADNLLAAGGRDVRAWIAFAFGFIHGFGFANVLREMDLPRRALGWSLFSFNIGVEIGQLAVVVAVAFLLAVVRSRSESAGRRVAFAGSLVVIAAGAFWFVQRVFFPA
jgi:hydrogenase/urease accessory protein HupE